jgi:ABC-type Na+ transport system ATPase subunit NatA
LTGCGILIVGIFLRYYKTYKGINFIPITDQDKFCGLLGDNGIGKSSVLESLDCFFNNRAWNLNIATKKSGLDSTNPHIVPVFLIKRNELKGEVFEKAAILNNVALYAPEEEIHSANRSLLVQFRELVSRLERNYHLDDYFIIPIGVDHQGIPSISIFNSKSLVADILGEDVSESKNSLTSDQLREFKPLLEKFKNLIEYIYIPREIDPELFTRLETNEIQILMGETLHEILEERVTPAQIAEINTSLNDFISQLSDELDIYAYRTPTDRQKKLRKNDVYNLIIEAFFNIRKLHKKEGSHWLEIGDLSSGEKQKAIIDVAHKFLLHHRRGGANLIIAIDEPESSLHMSACFDQFDALYDISRSCRQVLFSSHWYGFLPTIETGAVSVLSKKEGSHVFDLINLANYREQVKQMVRESKKRLPYDIRLKSINDFVQSVITSSISDTPYNWVICEGSSEKLYLSAYFSDLIEKDRLRIVPVGGAGEIKRLYNHIATSYEDFKDEISGKIILISDTDSQLVRYETKNHENLICKRIVNCQNEKTTKLVNIDSNPVSPKTEIEDSLNGLLFLDTLKALIDPEDDELLFLKEINEISQNSSFFALDLRSSEWEAIERFFDTDNNKYKFAKSYCHRLSRDYDIPKWIQEIRTWIE